MGLNNRAGADGSGLPKSSDTFLGSISDGARQSLQLFNDAYVGVALGRGTGYSAEGVKPEVKSLDLNPKGLYEATCVANKADNFASPEKRAVADEKFEAMVNQKKPEQKLAAVAQSHDSSLPWLKDYRNAA